jgi:hypothetical protein
LSDGSTSVFRLSPDEHRTLGRVRHRDPGSTCPELKAQPLWRGDVAQSLENRMTNIQYFIAHLPDDLNARFAGVDVKMATIPETQLLHTQRFSTIERKIDRLGGRIEGLEGSIGGLESRMDVLDAKVDRLDTKIDLILARLPSS